MAQHYNYPDRFRAPWVDAGVHQTRKHGARRLWLLGPSGERPYWLCAVSGVCSVSGDTRDQALDAARDV